MTMPSGRPILSVAPAHTRRSEVTASSTSDAAMPNGMSRRMFSLVSTSGRISAQIPRITKTLKMFEPTTLPIATSLLPAAAESTETTSSGIEVPTATIVRPMMNSGTRKRWATAAEPSVRKFAPPRISPRPTSSNRMSIVLSEYDETYGHQCHAGHYAVDRDVRFAVFTGCWQQFVDRNEYHDSRYAREDAVHQCRRHEGH